MDISKELTEIRKILVDHHHYNLNLSDIEWLGALDKFQKCGCWLCQAMIRITALEVNIAMSDDQHFPKV